MVQGVGNLGEDLYQSLFTKFTPAEVARRAKENKKFMESDDAAAWRLYVELSAQLERASVITHVRESIRKQVESTPGIRR
jgi:predicted component of type VI protein secretion system